MALPLGNIQQEIQSFREYWNEPIQKQSNQYFKIFQFTPISTVHYNDLDRAMAALSKDLTNTIEEQCREWHGVKVWPVLFVRYESANPLDEHFKTFDAHLPVSHSIFLYNQPELYANRINPCIPSLNRMAERLLEANAKFIRGKSGLVLAEIYSLNLNAVRFAPLSGSAWSPLSQFLQNKKAIVNVQSEDERCFGFAIASAIYPGDKNAHRPQMYTQYFEENGLDDIEYPVNPVDIPLLEQRLNISINLYSYFDDIGRARHPMYISRHKSVCKIDLLYFNEHYAWIKDFSRLFGDLTHHKRRSFFCKRCLGHFTLESAFERHQQFCTREDFISTLHILPEPDRTIKFTNWKFMTWAPFVIYADLESILMSVDQRRNSTHLYQNHKPCAASALLCSTVPAFNNLLYLFTGEESVSNLLDQLIKWEKEIVEHLKQNCKLKPLSRQQQTAHDNAVICCICHRQTRPFDPTIPNDRKVADHDHVTGYYIGAAHDECNRKRRVVFDIPVFFHNFRGYDSHLIVTALSSPQYRTREIQVIGQNMERYMQLKWGKNLVFRESLMFLTNSLESLVQSLRKTDEQQFKHLEILIRLKYPNADYKLLLRKGVFPYEYFDSFEKFNVPALPHREAFFSTLR